MKLFVIHQTGPYAMCVDVVRVESLEELEKTLEPLGEDNVFHNRTIKELVVDGEIENVFSAMYIE